MSTSFSRILTCYLIQSYFKDKSIKPLPQMFFWETYAFFKATEAAWSGATAPGQTIVTQKISPG